MGLGSYNRLKISGSVFVFTLFVILAHLNVGSSSTINRKLAVQFLSYENKNGGLLDGSCCDGMGQPGQCQRDACDSAFELCIRRVTNNTCDTTVLTTALENNNTVLTFGKTLDPLDVNSTLSLLVIPVPFDILETLLFEVTIREVDPHIANKTLTTANSDVIGNFTHFITPTHDEFSPHPDWHTLTFEDSVVKLVMNVTTFCSRYYYGDNCDIMCIPMDNGNGHFDCDPVTGGKLCKHGYEGGTCKTMSDMCVSSPCQNNASCSTIVAGDFNCACGSDYAGKTCDSSLVGLCRTSPCKHDGACRPLTNDFSCKCSVNYTGKVCESSLVGACHSSPCQNSGICEPTPSGNFTCTCTAGFTANTTAVAPGGGNEIRHDVTCGETEMSFSIPIPTNVTIPQIVTLSDPRCHLDTGGHRLQGRTPLNDCGTKVAFINDKVVFTNDIYLTYDKGSGSDLVIPIHCSYNRSDDLRLSYLPIVRQVLFTEEGVGHFGFAIQQFQDASYSAPVNEASYPLRVRPQQEVFVQLKLDEADLPVAASHPQAYGIEVEMCIASPSASMTEARQGQHQELIVNGCPANNGVRLLNNDNHGTSSSLTTATPAHPHDNIFRFCFEGVTFSSLPSGSPSGLVYIHCHVALCPRDKCRPSNASCPETPAADPAEAVPESDGHHVARRSVGAWRSQAAGHSLSTGPLWIIAVSEETNASSSPAVIALSVVAAVACLVAIAVIVAWRRGPRRGGGHYERVKVTEE